MSGGNVSHLPPVKMRSITFRSVGMGLLIAIAIVCVTPFNDYVVSNSFLVGSYFPPVVALAMLAIVLVINGPLHKWAPKAAFSSGELAIIIMMALVSCSVPSQGLMRQIIPSMVSPLYYAGQEPKFAELFQRMHIPPWTLATAQIEGAASRPEVTGFYARLPAGEPIPWGLWVKPLIGWGIFTAFFMTALVCIACLVRFQWAVNERLAFPIAQLQTLLIAPPKPGRAFNDIFASKGFWIALIAVVVVHCSFALNIYFPTGVPAIPFKYDLGTMMTELPLSGLPPWIRTGTIYFTLLGMAYFIPTRVSFSLWSGVVLLALIQWPLNLAGSTTLDGNVMADQQLGATFAFLGGILWIGRHHWAVIFRAIIGRSRANDARGLFIPYRVAAILLLVAMIGMVAWFIVLGCSWWLAMVIVLMILMAHLITARLVAETGLAYVRMPVDMERILTNFPATTYTPTDAYAYGLGHFNFMQAARESTLTFALHGIQTLDDSGASVSDKRKAPSLLVTTLVVSFIACAIASIWCYYSYAIPMDDPASGVMNVWATKNWPKTWLVDFPLRVDSGTFATKPQTPWVHIGIGMGVTIILQMLTWRFAGWPFLAVGYLLCSNFYMTGAAFSLFLGWLAKTIILRFGGATLFSNLKPVFIGFIFGEAVSTVLWLIVTMILATNGYDFKVVRFLPQ